MKARKMFIAFLVTALMVVVSPSAFAKHGWADTLQDAAIIYAEGGSNFAQSIEPIESYGDNDFYLIDNTYGGRFDYSVTLKSPPGLNYDMQLITVDPRGQIIQVRDVYDTGPGGTDGIGTSIDAGHKVYVRVQSHGYYDYSFTENYVLTFSKYN